MTHLEMGKGSLIIFDSYVKAAAILHMKSEFMKQATSLVMTTIFRGIFGNKAKVHFDKLV